MTMDLTDWRQEFRGADDLPPTATPQEKAARGRLLERILATMFDDAGLAPRLTYRPKGEEVDGSIWFHGRTILIEAKWTADSHPASSLYQLKGRSMGSWSAPLDSSSVLAVSVPIRPARSSPARNFI